jgi:regulatory protein
MAGRRSRSFTERRAERAAVDDQQVVLDAAARFLEARSRSVTEVRRRLTGAGYRPELVDGAVARLVELGVLDDEAFSRAWVESRDRARPRAERAIREELRTKGVDRATVELVLDERRTTAAAASDADDPAGIASVDEAAALRLLQRRASQLGRVPDPRVRRQRAYALLARNGFDPSVCATVARRFSDESEDASDDMGSEPNDPVA